jgi:LmbE family N-acetylglucosaminyl deacetylase
VGDLDLVGDRAPDRDDRARAAAVHDGVPARAAGAHVRRAVRAAHLEAALGRVPPGALGGKRTALSGAAAPDGGEGALFVFAHQDDEVPVLPRIAFERARGARVRCVYLTDGAGSVPAAVRDAESLGVLAQLGVGAADVGFLGGAHRIADGRLAYETERALELLRADAAARPAPARIYTPDWEGGHADHDACHVVALALARELGVADVFAYSLYNAYRRPRGFFRVTSFVPASAPLLRRKLALGEALMPVRALARYPSQRRTWLGLGPGLALRALARREERLRRADPSRLRLAPHPGTLLYESMFKVPARAVLDATAELRERILRTS